MRAQLHYAGNVFIKEVFLEHAGDVMEGHEHLYDHLTMIAQGVVDIFIEDQPTRIVAPRVVLIRKNVRHAMVAVEGPVMFACIHALHDGDTGELLDETVIPYTTDQVEAFRLGNMKALIK